MYRLFWHTLPAMIHELPHYKIKDPKPTVLGMWSRIDIRHYGIKDPKPTILGMRFMINKKKIIVVKLLLCNKEVIPDNKALT